MSDEITKDNVVHFADGSRNPVIEIGSDCFLEFFRHVADKEGFADRSLQGIQLIVDGKALMTIPKMVIMVSNLVDRQVEPEPETEKQIGDVSVERTVDINLPRSRDFAIDEIGFYSKPQTPEQLAAMSDEDFDRVCEQYAYIPEEKTNDG